MPSARDEDWTLKTAGQRVQIMKQDAVNVGKIQFGTEILTSAHGSLAGLMGASPGASVSVQIAVDALEKCFPDKFNGEWHSRLVHMIPGHKQKLNDNPEFARQVSDMTADVLNIYDVQGGYATQFDEGGDIGDAAAKTGAGAKGKSKKSSRH